MKNIENEEELRMDKSEGWEERREKGWVVC